MARQLKALGNPVRLRIFRRLLVRCVPGVGCDAPGELSQCVGDLGREFDLAPSTVSHHLKELRQAGLVRAQRQAKTVLCWVPEEIAQRYQPLFRQE